MSSLSEVRFLTVAEVAAIMRVSKMTVYRLVHSGELTSVRVGRSFRVPEHAVHEYLRRALALGSVSKKRRKRMAKKKHRNVLNKTRVQCRNKKSPPTESGW